MKQPMLRFKADDGFDFPDWEEKTLGNEGKFYGGLSGKDKKDFETGDACFVTYMNVYKNTFARQDMAGCVSVGAGEKQNKVLCGDLLFTQSSETVEEVGLSSVYLHDDEPYLNSFCMGYRFNNPKEVCPKFIGYCMRSDGVRKSIMPMGQGISRINLSAKRLGTVSFRIPSLPEQRKIADLLSTVDSVIAAQQAEADAWEQRKKGVMQKLFSQEVRFKADDGSDFLDWDEKPLGELTNLFVGKSFTSELSENGHYVVMDMGSVSPDGSIIDTKLTDSTRDLLNKDDLIMPKDDIGGGLIIGKTAYIPCDGKYVCGDHVYRLRFGKGVDGLFMHYDINSTGPQKRLARKVTGSAQLGLNSKNVSSEIISIPSLSEQRKIANCLSSIDDVIAKEKAELAKWQELKKGLLQQMFV